MKLIVIDEAFSVCKVESVADVDFGGGFCFVGKTDEEISVVCGIGHVPAKLLEREDGWRAMRIEGMLEFSMVGVLAKISTLLADEGISICAVSTYNTDYILTKEDVFESALGVLAKAGYTTDG
jgi:hypothetical protein